MITVNLRDRLGNRLFQYAAGKQLALRHKTTLRLSLNNFGRGRHGYGKEQIDEMLACGVEARAFRYERLRNYYRRRFGQSFREPETCYKQPDLSYDPKFHELPNGTFIKGIFQSEQFFKDAIEEIRESLKFSHDFIADEHDALAQKMLKEPSIALHVRRGDYMQDPMFQVCTADYYHNAVEHLRGIKGKLPIYIFSDDPAWCREALQIDDSTVVDTRSANRDASYDLKMMSLCHHQIISNSTYSWWSAWLNRNPDKLVLAPYRWFTYEDKNEEINGDIIPESWTRIEF